jgi:hypothetical protein
MTLRFAQQTSCCLALTLLIAAPIGVAAAKLQIQRDPVFDFVQLKTWSWNPAGAGEVNVLLSKESKSEPVQRKYEPTLMQAIDDQFAARGYTRQTATYAPPDFHVTYRLLVTVGSWSHEMGQFLPATTNWGLPLFTPQTTALTVYPMGTLIVDVASTSAAKPVWRGIAEAKIELDNSEKNREARIKRVVKDLLSKFPKSPKTK